ncbi:Carbonic anhydrase 12 [Collichthys lucidus]|uniref:Carbonic anhydrase 12 n=1 Tax=Collichthys lucidus TaxID=240159 RepID=A0A4U5UIZ0_COLLU|nr:Carbonic anhydrase 12 [Collichthys lucidus]
MRSPLLSCHSPGDQMTLEAGFVVASDVSESYNEADNDGYKKPVFEGWVLWCSKLVFCTVLTSGSPHTRQGRGDQDALSELHTHPAATADFPRCAAWCQMDIQCASSDTLMQLRPFCKLHDLTCKCGHFQCPVLYRNLSFGERQHSHWLSPQTTARFSLSLLHKGPRAKPLASPMPRPDGENHWSKHYPYCGGAFQSPINIKAELLRFDPTLGPIAVQNYNLLPNEQLTLGNNGHAACLIVTLRVKLHFHWGTSNRPLGSEHMVNNKQYAAERNQGFQTLLKQKKLCVCILLLQLLDTVADISFDIYSPVRQRQKKAHCASPTFIV